MPLYYTVRLSHNTPFQCNVQYMFRVESKAHLVPSLQACTTWGQMLSCSCKTSLHSSVHSLYLANEGTLILLHCAKCSFSISHLSFSEYTSRINSKKKIHFRPIVPKHQFLTELCRAPRVDSKWRLMVRKTSQIASLSLLHYLLMLSKTVLLMSSIHKSNLK